MEKVTRKGDLGILWRILKRAKPYTLRVLIATALALVLAPLRSLAPYIINQLVDVFTQGSIAEEILKWVLIYISVMVLQVLVEYVFVYGTEWLGQRIVLDLRNELFDRLLDYKMRYFDQTPIGKNTTRVISDIETLGLVFTRQGLTMIVADLFSIFAVLYLMLITSVKLTLICVGTIPLMLIATYIFKEKVKLSFEIVRKKISEMNSFLQERISGMKTIQVMNVEEREGKVYKALNRAYTKANLNTIQYYAVFFPVVEIISSFALALMIWLGAGGVVKGELTLGVLVAFPMYVNRLFRPIRFLADKFNNVQMAMVASKRVFSLLDKEEYLEDTGEQSLVGFKGQVEFEHLYFSYDGQQDVLKDISFFIPAGSTTAIVGATGSGKTSIINIICKLYEYHRGHARIDGIEIKTLNNETLRRHLGIVLQDVFLFTGSILDNIRLRDQSISKQKVIDAARSIGAHEIIEHFPDQYDHILQERGANLSVGQRQLIAFVRVLVFDPTLLILDEATSSIDTMTERVIQKAIDKLTKDRTTIIIAHRLATIKNSNQVIVLDKGRIVEHGQYDELVQTSDGYFKKLYDMQFQTSVGEALS